jgi:biopolymer transport protein ExbD
MRFRERLTVGDEKIRLQMTPMIDIVFQLLVFFIMSFKIVAQEGDFNIKMPIPARAEGLPDQSSLPMLIRLRAGADGRLAGITMDGQPFDHFQELHNYVIAVVGGDEPALREEAEVELDCDYDLHYEHVIDAITAVSGYIDSTTGRVVKLVEKIKFAPPQEDPAASR